MGELLEIETLWADTAALNADVTREVDRAKVAHGGLAGIRNLENLGAQVRQVHRPPGLGGLIARPVRLVLERHPAVTGLRKRAHHPHIQIASPYRLLGESACLSLDVGRLERLSVQVRQLGHVFGIEQRPLAVLLHPAHEQIGNPVREIQVMRTATLVAGVVP